MRLESKTLLVMVIAAIVLVIVAVVVATAIPLLQKNPQTTTTNQTRTVDNNSIVVEGRGLRVILNYTSLDLKLGDRFLYTTVLENVNSPSRLALAQSKGVVVTEAYNETGVLVMKASGVYAIGPPGPLKANFVKGENWPLAGFWDTGSVPNDIPSPTKIKAGNYILVVKYYYYNLDLGAEEELGIQTSLRISE